jgi:hypothetical protein
MRIAHTWKVWTACACTPVLSARAVFHPRETVEEGLRAMGLKAPGILTFLVSIVLVVTVLMIKFFGAEVPLLKNHEFWGLLVGHLILVYACLMRTP